MADFTDELKAELFAPDDANVFAVLDGASVPDLLDRLYAPDAPEWECLYRGELAPDMAEVAPYLVALEPDHDFTDWLLAKGWGAHWGIFATGPGELFDLRQHFRRFLRVAGPEGESLYFRYYDPRVLRVYLPTCNAEELAELFGEVLGSYMMEDEAAAGVLRFQNESGQLKQTEHPLKALQKQ